MIIMNTMVLIVVLALVVYLCRLSGFVLKIQNTSLAWEQFLRYVPISVFSALVVPSLIGDIDLLGIKVVALGVATAILLRTKQFGVAVVVGMLVMWIFA
jgi:branched-subunit amino acid transport protein